MAIKCGNCKEYHDTVDEVKLCSGLVYPADPHQVQRENRSPVQVMDELSGVKTQINPPSTKQISYAMSLLDTRVWPDTFTEEDLKAMERRQVSELIDGLTKAKKKNLSKGANSPKSEDKFTDIPDGRYALGAPEREGDEEVVWKFFQVKHGHTHTFLDLLIGSPRAYRHQKLYGVAARKVLSEIRRVTPRQASIDFGLKSKTCGVCSSPLTNPESIKLGIGPICRGKMGW